MPKTKSPGWGSWLEGRLCFRNGVGKVCGAGEGEAREDGEPHLHSPLGNAECQIGQQDFS